MQNHTCGHSNYHQTTGPTRKRRGHKHRPGFTGGNLEGVCVPNAFKRQNPHFSDQPHTRKDNPNA